MSKIDDMHLFVQVVKSGGLAAAGRQLGLSPASMTARIQALEARYQTRLLNRSTRSISLTDAGQQFYDACLRVVAEVTAAEAVLQSTQTLSGPLRVTATSDFGRQYVAPALAAFVQNHPRVQPYLNLTDGIVNLIAEGFDIGIRFGHLPDSQLMMRSLTQDNRRILCAAPAYLAQYGVPQQPEEIAQHRCLVIERLGELSDRWYFSTPETQQIIRVKPALSSNDGALIRHWALAGAGIALKLLVDIKHDLATQKLVALMTDYTCGVQAYDDQHIGLQLLYPSRKFLPRQVASFIDYFSQYLDAANSLTSEG